MVAWRAVVVLLLGTECGGGWGPVALADFKSVVPRFRGRWVRLPRTLAPPKSVSELVFIALNT